MVKFLMLLDGKNIMGLIFSLGINIMETIKNGDSFL